jgi:Zn-dependent protease with chaperone function
LEQQAVNSLKISGGASSFLRWFSSHPPLEERILRLKESSARW